MSLEFWEGILYYLLLHTTVLLNTTYLGNEAVHFMYPRDKITEQKVNIHLTNTSKLGGGDFNIFTMQFISRLQPNVDLSSVHS